MPAEAVPQHGKRRGALRLAAAVGAAGLVVTTMSAGWIWHRSIAARQTRLDAAGDSVAAAFVHGVEEVGEWLSALRGLYQASDTVSQDEFSQFIGILGPKPGLDAVAYAPLVEAADLESFLTRAQASSPGFEVTAWSPEVPQPEIAPAASYAPILHGVTSHGEIPFGFDELSEPRRRAALDWAAASGGLALTPVLPVLGVPIDNGFVGVRAVNDPSGTSVEGFVLAAVDLTATIDENLPASTVSSVTWTVTDVSDGHAPAQAGGTWRRAVALGGRDWEVTVGLQSPAGLPIDAVLVMLEGAGGSIVAAAASYLLVRRAQSARELANLQDAARAKNSFLAAVSHALRTPLTAVLGYGRLLQENSADLSAEERSAMVGAIVSQAAELEYLLQDVIAVTRIEDGLLSVQPRRMSPGAEVALVLTDVAAIGRGHIEIIDELRAEDWVIADPYRVRQIIRILLDNTAKHGGSWVKIRLTRVAGGVTVAVSDNGGGIPPGSEDTVFARYQRANPRHSQPETLGIGLSIGRQLARMMGGDLTYRRADGWTTFELVLTVTPMIELTPADSPFSFALTAGSHQGGSTTGQLTAAQ
ncbi:MAG: hypothetical protein A2Z12_10340 [Actinobacteria bacterium RBG_16_68_21]|nr:MAG: hypothetical protein A2Z12_10340 [Actinobacteria bacterium RBG_16_68_21]